jgi:putative heme iron utilization protein
MDEPKDVIIETTADAVRLAKTLLRTARSAAIATLAPDTGWPIATRVGVSTDFDGAPVLLISRLAAHTKALLADPRCSLLVGTPGKGDPLAHARLSLACTAHEIARGSADEQRVGARYLSHQPKAELYAGLGDFRYFRLAPESAALNGGFGRAYALSPADLLGPDSPELAEAEAGAIAHMNGDHIEAVALYAEHFAKGVAGNWRLIGIDAEGFELADGDDIRRVWFDVPVASTDELRAVLARMAGEARRALNRPLRDAHLPR